MLTTAFVPPTGRDALPRDPALLNGKELHLRERKCVFAEAPKRLRRDLGRRTRESASLPSPDPALLNGKEHHLRERKCVFAEAPKRMRRDLGRRTRESASLPSPEPASLNGKELHLRERKRVFAEAPKRSVETWGAGRARARPTPGMQRFARYSPKS